MKKLIFTISFFLISSHLSFGQWNHVNSGTSYNITNVTLPTTSLFYATAYNPTGWAGTLLKSTNGGINWTQSSLPSALKYPTGIDFDPTGTHGIIIGVGPIMITSNGGANWETTWTSADTVIFFAENTQGTETAAFWVVGNKFLGGTSIGVPVVVMSPNLNAINAIFYRLSLPSSYNNYQLTGVSAVDSNSCYISAMVTVGGHATGGSILKTTNRGANWTETLFFAELMSVHVDAGTGSTGLGFATGGGTDSGYVFKTTNYGATWSPVLGVLTGSLNALDGSNNIYAAGMNGKIYMTNNNGNTWTSQNTGVSNDLNAIKHSQSSQVMCAVGDGGTILVTTNGGVWVKNISSEVPDKYSLSQNYPNPFNPNTIIKFQIQDSKFVTLKVYDILGKEIATLVNEKLQPGIYEVPFSINQFSNNQFPSGVYYYKIEAGSFTETKKMILIK